MTPALILLAFLLGLFAGRLTRRPDDPGDLPSD